MCGCPLGRRHCHWPCKGEALGCRLNFVCLKCGHDSAGQGGVRRPGWGSIGACPQGLPPAPELPLRSGVSWPGAPCPAWVSVSMAVGHHAPPPVLPHPVSQMSSSSGGGVTEPQGRPPGVLVRHMRLSRLGRWCCSGSHTSGAAGQHGPTSGHVHGSAMGPAGLGQKLSFMLVPDPWGYGDEVRGSQG